MKQDDFLGVMRQEECLRRIIARPDDDAQRLFYAEVVRGIDLERAELIDLQLRDGSRRRRKESSELLGGNRREKQLLQKRTAEWASAILESCVTVEFDRGFASRIGVEPNLFIEKGRELLQLGPIRAVDFDVPSGGDRFPMEALSKCPLLAELDFIGLSALDLSDEDIRTFASSPFLTRCLSLDLSSNPIGFEAFHALAKAPDTRKILNIERHGGSRHNYHPRQEFWENIPDGPGIPYESEWLPLKQDGQALEREFGYIPWLHPQDNACSKFDARYFVEQGILPKKPPGSPVEQ